ncbi:MAG: hypothetical protein V3U30_04075 [Thermoplasmata archaeon]
MWEWDPSKDGQVHGRKEAELARYFKLEYGEAEVGRLLAQTRAARPPSPGRFWAGLRQRVASRRQNGRRSARILGHTADARSPKAVASASAASTGSPPVRDMTPRDLPVDCRHAEWKTLGSGGSTTYLQCKACEVLVVSQGGRLWSFGRGQPEGI